jgi:hypothetical protein
MKSIITSKTQQITYTHEASKKYKVQTIWDLQVQNKNSHMAKGQGTKSVN